MNLHLAEVCECTQFGAATRSQSNDDDRRNRRISPVSMYA